jgi:hypothetical protein
LNLSDEIALCIEHQWDLGFVLSLDFPSFYALLECVERNSARERLIVSRLGFMAAQCSAAAMEKHLEPFVAVLTPEKHRSDQSKLIAKIGGGF